MEEARGSRVPGFSVPPWPMARPLGHLSSGLGLCRSHQPYVACVPPPSLHPTAWFKAQPCSSETSDRARNRPRPAHSGGSTASADGLASALPGPPPFHPLPEAEYEPFTHTRGVRGSASGSDSWQRPGLGGIPLDLQASSGSGSSVGLRAPQGLTSWPTCGCVCAVRRELSPLVRSSERPQEFPSPRRGPHPGGGRSLPWGDLRTPSSLPQLRGPPPTRSSRASPHVGALGWTRRLSQAQESRSEESRSEHTHSPVTREKQSLPRIYRPTHPHAHMSTRPHPHTPTCPHTHMPTCSHAHRPTRPHAHGPP